MFFFNKTCAMQITTFINSEQILTKLVYPWKTRFMAGWGCPRTCSEKNPGADDDSFSRVVAIHMDCSDDKDDDDGERRHSARVHFYFHTSWISRAHPCQKRIVQQYFIYGITNSNYDFRWIHKMIKAACIF